MLDTDLARDCLKLQSVRVSPFSGVVRLPSLVEAATNLFTGNKLNNLSITFHQLHALGERPGTVCVQWGLQGPTRYSKIAALHFCKDQTISPASALPARPLIKGMSSGQ